jgi:hypothetical protein
MIQVSEQVRAKKRWTANQAVLVNAKEVRYAAIIDCGIFDTNFNLELGVLLRPHVRR